MAAPAGYSFLSILENGGLCRANFDEDHKLMNNGSSFNDTMRAMLAKAEAEAQTQPGQADEA